MKYKFYLTDFVKNSSSLTKKIYYITKDTQLIKVYNFYVNQFFDAIYK